MQKCPECSSDNAYHDGSLYVCPDCFHEWQPDADKASDGVREVKDSNGNILADGDSIILIKDLKLKGSSTIIKKGSKAKNIRLVDGDHEIDCKVDDIKVMLKASFVKKTLNLQSAFCFDKKPPFILKKGRILSDAGHAQRSCPLSSAPLILELHLRRSCR